MPKRLTDGDKIWAWERFLSGSPEAAIPLGQVVVSSWQRSLKLGVNPAARTAPLAATGARYFALRHRNRDLLAAAADIFLRMESVLSQSRCMMLLTDPFGVVLETAGDHRTLGEGENIHLVAGGQWNEDVIGTNGIGTALATGQPAQVHATEHFCEGIKSWTCAAAPVREPGTGKILGILDISGPPTTYQRGNLSLAVATARQIETALAERAGRERVRLLERCLQMMPTLGNTEMLAIDRAGRVIFSHGNVDPIAGLPGFDADEKFEDWVGRLPAALRRTGNFDTVDLDGRPVGAMIVLPGPKTRRIAATGAFESIVGASPAIREMIDLAARLAPRRVALLIQGETGTGKEVLLRAVHAAAAPAAPLVVFNCGAASKDLLGAELFGHVRGAFTGALQEGRAGRFELAHGGILCLDEIGELPLDMQPLLLRVLEEGVVYRVGDATPRKIDVRIIAMTNRNLKQDVAAGRFRADLFFRLSVATIAIPPLRDRHGDVARLFEHFSALLAARHDLPPRGISPQALQSFDAYGWPGNVRELRNIVESLLLTGAGEITADELPPDMRNVSRAADDDGLEALSRQAMRRAIESADGNLSQAAKKLGISRSTLHRRLRRDQSI
jgi:transcriptional regulator of acetoin/glycerol metabolism